MKVNVHQNFVISCDQKIRGILSFDNNARNTSKQVARSKRKAITKLVCSASQTDTFLRHNRINQKLYSVESFLKQGQQK